MGMIGGGWSGPNAMNGSWASRSMFTRERYASDCRLMKVLKIFVYLRKRNQISNKYIPLKIRKITSVEPLCCSFVKAIFSRAILN